MALVVLTLPNVVVGAATTIIVAILGKVVYNIFLHPLRHFPGPLLWRALGAPYLYHYVKGDLPSKILELHNRYGATIRITPKTLAFIDPQAWKDIYGHRVGAKAGAEEFPKLSHFYRNPGIAPNLISEPRQVHGMIRKQLSKGFSDRSIHFQEPLIAGYVELLIQRLRENCVVEDSFSDEKGTEARLKALDIKAWYNFTTFDIIGDLAFGEPFGCLENSDYHPWVDAIANFIDRVRYVLFIKEIGLGFILSWLSFFLKYEKLGRSYSHDKLKRRMAIETPRPDLIQPLLETKDFDMPMDRLVSHGNLLVTAGSETTATLLSGVTYLLLRNPEAMAKLKKEVRSSFKSENEITLTSVAKLDYMLACLDEGLRMYPPVPIGLPRVVPKGGDTIAGSYVPQNTIVGCWQLATNYSPMNWTDAESFLPERFIDPKLFPNDRRDALQPFSVGPRNCLGRNLAYAEMRLILARVLYNFDMELADPKTDWLRQSSYILWVKPQLNVYLKPVPQSHLKVVPEEHLE